MQATSTSTEKCTIAVSTGGADDESLLPVIEFLFPYVIYGRCPIYLVSKTYCNLWRLFIRNLRTSPGLLFSYGIPRDISLASTVDQSSDGNSVEIDFISLFCRSRGPNESRIDFLRHVQMSCIQSALGGQENRRHLIPISQFLVLSYCVVYDMCTARAPYNCSEILNGTAEELAHYALDLVTKGVPIAMIDIQAIAQLYERYSLAVSLVKCSFGYLDAYYRNYHGFVNFDQFLLDIFETELSKHGVELHYLDSRCVSILQSQGLHEQLVRFVCKFSAKLPHSQRFVSGYTVCKTATVSIMPIANFIFFHRESGSCTVPASHPLIQGASSLRQFVDDLRSFEAARGQSRSCANLFIPPRYGSNCTLQAAMRFAEHHATHEYSTIERPLTSNDMRNVVSEFDASFVLSMEQDELFDAILLSKFLGYKVKLYMYNF